MAHIFISYASEDQGIADDVASDLKTRGAAVWFATREIERAGGPFVQRIEEGLAGASIVLVLWSRHAAASPWVQDERNAALAMRRTIGRNLRVVMARLDDIELPPLSAAELPLDLRDGGREKDALATLTSLAELLREGAIPSSKAARLHEAEVERKVAGGSALALVDGLISRRKPVAVLMSRQGGSTTFTRQLQAHLRQHMQGAEVFGVEVVCLPGEDVGAYLVRLRKLMQLDQRSDRYRVACLSGWSRAPVEHREALGRVLRAAMEGPGAQMLTLVAIGGYALYRARFDDQMSALNNTELIVLEDLGLEDVHALMRAVDARWSEQDARAVQRATGGHPMLVKRVLELALGPGGERAVERVLQDWAIDRWQRAFEVARRPPMSEARLRAEIGRLRKGSVSRATLDVAGPLPYLFYEGLTRLVGERYELRCSVVRSVLEDMLAGEIVA